MGEEEQENVELRPGKCHQFVVEVAFLVVAVDAQPFEGYIGL